MAGAMIGGLIQKKIYSKDEIIACAPSEETRKRVSDTYGIKMYKTAKEVAENAEIIVLAIKPKHIPSLFEEEGFELGSKHLVLSIVAGVKLATLNSYVPDSRIIRIMPNHCCMVLEGVSGYSRGANATDEDVETTQNILSALGFATEVCERDLETVTGLSGSSPAYLYMVIKAIADAGVLSGMSRDISLKLAAHSMIGAGKMVLESGMTPEQLIDGVCSPGGTTMEGVNVLKENGMETIMVEAVNASIQKAIKMGKTS